LSAFVVGLSWSTTHLAVAAGLGLLVLVFVTAVLVCCKYWRHGTDTPRPTPPTEQGNRLLELGINVRES